ncbi:MAG: hypothetical protein IT185_06000 [Acidobacteria bacterium]|nr:hypothetical protein [Acidobacteriota bacterium]
MTNQDLEQHVRAYRWPELSPDVRTRVMAAAVTPVNRSSWSDLVWFSRVWRLSAAAAFIALLSWDQLGGVTVPRGIASESVLAEAQAIKDTAIDVGLPAETAAWLAERSVIAALQPHTLQPPAPAMLDTLAFETTGGM